MVCTLEPFDLRELVKNAVACCQLVSSMLPELEVSFSVPEDIALTVISDPRCLLRAIINLLNNSCSHTKEGSVCLSLSLVTQGNDTWLEFAVTDTGCGHVPDSDIWEPFNSSQNTKGYGSRGMGLFVVSRTSAALGGSCGSHTNPSGVGSVFWLQIPYTPSYTALNKAPLDNKTAQSGDNDGSDLARLAAELGVFQDGSSGQKSRTEPTQVGRTLSRTGGKEHPLLEAQLKVKAPEAPGPAGEKHHILLIDDVLALLRLQGCELETYGLKVTVAHGPIEGMTSLQQRGYALVLCDFKMAGKDGPQLVSEFRQWEAKNRTNRQYICALTAYTNAEIRSICLSHGMDGLLNKPLDAQAIFDMLKEPGEI